MSAYEQLFRALNDAGIRYVVVGGLAVVLHGHARLTADADLVVDLEPEEARKAVEALTALGLTPVIPEPATGFADPETRKRWIREKGMQVFSLFDPADPLLRVGLFVDEPIPFDELFGRAEILPLATTRVRVASIPDLIRMKRLADRPRDREDVEQLERLLEARGDG